MIIKRMDSRQKDIEELSSLLKGCLTSNQRFLIERELEAVKKGFNGEKDAAYYIDYYYEQSKNWAVIHDLSLEHKNQTAQIDHLMINRLFYIYVLESKSYSYGLTISPGGEFQAVYGKRSYGIPSPVEQNERHIHFLDNFLTDHDILPKRMGITIRPKFKNLVLVSPKCVITRPPDEKFDMKMVIKADALKTKIDQAIDKANFFEDLASVSKITSSSSIEELARRLVSFHKPGKIDFRAKFGLSAPELTKLPMKSSEGNGKANSNRASNYFCNKCKEPISEKVAKFCWQKQNLAKFGGKPYCLNCQRSF
jgi:hypothetical protein